MTSWPSLSFSDQNICPSSRANLHNSWLLNPSDGRKNKICFNLALTSFNNSASLTQQSYEKSAYLKSNLFPAKYARSLPIRPAAGDDIIKFGPSVIAFVKRKFSYVRQAPVMIFGEKERKKLIKRISSNLKLFLYIFSRLAIIQLKLK